MLTFFYSSTIYSYLYGMKNTLTYYCLEDANAIYYFVYCLLDSKTYSNSNLLLLLIFFYLDYLLFIHSYMA